MLIDWFTVGAQALNFLVLVWLMKRFLYRPVIDAIDAREQRVAAVLADADAKKDEARHERDDLQAQHAAFDQQRAALWATANDEAQAERRRLLDAAAQAAGAIAAKRHDALLGEAAALHHAIGVRAQQEVFAIARQTLAELADAALEDRVCAVFIGRLRALDAAAKERLTSASRAAADPARLRSAFDLPEARRAALQHAVNETCSADVPLQFETAPERVAGIELTVGGQLLDWSIAGHLDALSKSVDALVRKPVAAEAPADATAEVAVDAPAEATTDAKADARPVAKPTAAAEPVAA